MKYIVRVECVNFSATLLDTDDLSTNRGSGLAALYAPAYIFEQLALITGDNVEIIWTGASAGAAVLDAANKTTAEKIETAIANILAGEASELPGASEHTITSDVLKWLSLTYAAVELGEHGFNTASNMAEARCRDQQLQRLTLEVPAPLVAGKWRACALDGKRPRTVEIHFGGGKKWVSESVAARREYGRRKRRDFYELELGKIPPGISDFAQSFEDLVSRSPADLMASPSSANLPETLVNKMAVIYLDGNKFRKQRDTFLNRARDKNEDVAGATRTFSQHIKKCRNRMLGSLLTKFSEDRNMFYDPAGGDPRLRFETLMWGGDEAFFVLPAWKAMEAISIVAAELKGAHWAIEGQPDIRLTHAVGVLVCNYKTPIAMARNLAEDLANSTKTTLDEKALENVWSIQVLESLDPPSDLDRFRKRIYGTDKAEAFALNLDNGADEIIETMLQLKGAGGKGAETALPRSQVYNLIHALKEKDAFSKGTDGKCLQAKIIKSRQALLDRESVLEKINSPAFGFAKEHPLVPLLRVAELWDYVDPLQAISSSQTMQEPA